MGGGVDDIHIYYTCMCKQCCLKSCYSSATLNGIGYDIPQLLDWYTDTMVLGGSSGFNWEAFLLLLLCIVIFDVNQSIIYSGAKSCLHLKTKIHLWKSHQCCTDNLHNTLNMEHLYHGPEPVKN